MIVRARLRPYIDALVVAWPSDFGGHMGSRWKPQMDAHDIFTSGFPTGHMRVTPSDSKIVIGACWL